MTKRVRVENADGGNHVAIRARVFHQRTNGVCDPQHDSVVDTRTAQNPGDASELHLSTGTYIVLDEVPSPGSAKA